VDTVTGLAGSDAVAEVVGLPAPAYATPLLGAIAGQAAAADRSRTVDPAVIAAIKASPLMKLSASRGLGGLEAPVADQAWELAAVAAACGSVAWCLWNHLCVYHLYCGALGPGHEALLGAVVEAGEWVCFPGGAGSRVYGLPDGDVVTLNGRGTFGSGCRYADWTAVAFALGDGTSPPRPEDLRFTILRLDEPGVSIEETWDGMAVRASSTDTVHYADVVVPLDRCVPWFAANPAEIYRDPTLPMVDHRYREDWVGLSDLWLAAMALGTAGAALSEAAAGIVGRKAIMGASMAQLPAVQANLGEAASRLATARLALQGACAEVDARIAAEAIPTEADYQRQAAVSVVVIGLCQQAMDLLLRTLGGNGLREGGTFERRWRDFSAMGVHINAHPDRVWSRLGQLLLDQPLNRF
jgi:3-hydroxy-9,10-secoandrosta-1,3,5(10)-triene-9,17-dione monooxygenase